MRTATITLLALLLAGTAMAQTKPIMLGFKGGVDYASLVFDPENGVDTDPSIGLAAGGLLGFMISPGMSLDTDVLYIQKGAKRNDLVPTKADDASEVTFRYSYIVINPMLRFAVQNQGLRPYFLAGVEIGFLVDAKTESNVEEFDGQDLKDQTKSTDFGVNLGAGLEFPSGTSALFIEGRYALGLTDITDTSDDDEIVEDQVEVKHRGIYALAGIRF